MVSALAGDAGKNFALVDTRGTLLRQSGVANGWGERALFLSGGIHRAGAKVPDGAAGASLGIGLRSVLSAPFIATFVEVTGVVIELSGCHGHLARNLVVNRAGARPSLAKIRSLVRRNRILICENQ